MSRRKRSYGHLSHYTCLLSCSCCYCSFDYHIFAMTSSHSHFFLCFPNPVSIHSHQIHFFRGGGCTCTGGAEVTQQAQRGCIKDQIPPLILADLLFCLDCMFCMHCKNDFENVTQSPKNVLQSANVETPSKAMTGCWPQASLGEQNCCRYKHPAAPKH